jgi:hypothetical protein
VLILMMWSAPRSRSTAFFRMMIERGDFTAVHEPFSYLAEFGHVNVGGARVTSAPMLITAFRSLARARQVFIKETTGKRYPEVLSDRRFLTDDALHTFLIRHPRDTISSYLTVNPDAPLHKIGFESQCEVYARIAKVTGRDPVVVDADDLVSRPADTIKAYCARVGIDFWPDTLTWQPSDRPEWELSQNWHTDVAASSTFSQIPRKPVADADQHPMLNRYLDYHLPFYQRLYERRLVI